MPAKIMSEMPLPIPCSVSNWPNQTPNIVPAVIPIIMVSDGKRLSPVKPQFGKIGKPPVTCWRLSSVDWVIACKIASGIVNQ